jgi:general L-amino acid transport system substrate-binding protein
MVEHQLTGQVIPGPAVFVERTGVLVEDDAPYKHLEELAGKPICFPLGDSHAEYHLHGWFAAHRLDFAPMGWREDIEMNDAYKVRYCHGLAGDETTLAETAHSRDMGDLKSRFLPETLAAFPILATSSVKDGEWAAVVAWTVETLKRAEAPESYWVRGGVASMPVEAPALGLEKGWQKKLVDLMGTYGQLFDKNLGAGSGLKLERGLNGAVGQQGAFAPPYVE